MLKTVGTSGQLSLGKKLAGRHYEMEVRADGSILLAPVKVSRDAGRKPAARSPRFHVFEVKQFSMPTREQMHERGRVR